MLLSKLTRQCSILFHSYDNYYRLHRSNNRDMKIIFYADSRTSPHIVGRSQPIIHSIIWISYGFNVSIPTVHFMCTRTWHTSSITLSGWYFTVLVLTMWFLRLYRCASITHTSHLSFT